MLNSPRHSVAYAQNFLHSPRLVDHLLDRSSIGPNDRVLEIGPGKGIITAALARRCREILAVEKDPDLALLLRARFALSPAVTIREDDFLGTRLPLPPYKVFANVPFNCTAEIIMGQQARLRRVHRTRQRRPRLSPGRADLTGSASGLHGVRSAGGAAPRRC